MCYYDMKTNKIYYEIGDEMDLSLKELKAEIKRLKAEPDYAELDNDYKTVYAYYYYYCDDDGEQDRVYVAKWNDDGELIRIIDDINTDINTIGDNFKIKVNKNGFYDDGIRMRKKK